MKLREHRGGLAESMDTVVEISPTIEAVTRHVNRVLEAFGVTVQPQAVHVREYGAAGPDKRNGWKQTFIVTVDDYGVFGFCDQDVTR
jgi:hypothetical protein